MTNPTDDDHTGEASPPFEGPVFREIYHSVNDAIFVHDAETGAILDVNETACEMYGYSRESFRQLTIDAISAESGPYTQEVALDHMERAAAGEPQVFEWRAKRRDDSVFWVEVSMRRAVVDADPIILVIVRDITERKAREQELRELTEEYEAVFEHAADAIFLIDVTQTESDIEFHFERLNPAHEATSGMTTEGIRGKTPREALGEEFGAEVAANYRRCVEAGEPITYEEELPMPEGRIVWQTNLAPVFVDGSVARIVGVARDITDRKQRERELEQFHAFVANATDVITLLDPAGRPQYMNPAVERILGYDQDDLLGEDIVEYMHPHDREDVRAAIDRLVRAPDSVETAEFRLEHADGYWVWFESRARNLLDEPGIEGLVVNSREITDRKEYEEKLVRANEQLRILNRIVRHDIRNDMNVAVGWSRELGAHVDAEGQAILDRIEGATNHVIDLTKTVRDFVEALGTDDRVEVEPIDLESVLDAELAKRRSTYPEATFVIDNPKSTLTVAADELLSSVFRNILNNAVQHNPKDNPRVEVETIEHDDTVTVRIADNGPGIPDGLQDSIFGRSDDGLDDPAAGVGLYLVDQLVDSYGGEVWIEDNEPEGSVFAVELRKAGSIG